MAILVPSVLETEKAAFMDRLSQEEKLPGVSRIQIDFGDGVFVPNRMVPVSDMDVFSPAIQFEAHLMMQSPVDFLDYQICGFKTIIVHYEAYSSESRLWSALRSIKEQGTEAAVCLKIETSVEVLQKFYPDIKHFQLMGIHPGFQGTQFLEQTYAKITRLREMCPNAILEVDGGINETNIKLVADAGADLIILGSAITKTQNMAGAWEKLKARLL